MSRFRVLWTGEDVFGTINPQGVSVPTRRAALDLAADLERDGATDVRVTYRGREISR